MLSPKRAPNSRYSNSDYQTGAEPRDKAAASSLRDYEDSQRAEFDWARTSQHGGPDDYFDENSRPGLGGSHNLVHCQHEQPGEMEPNDDHADRDHDGVATHDTHMGAETVYDSLLAGNSGATRPVLNNSASGGPKSMPTRVANSLDGAVSPVMTLTQTSASGNLNQRIVLSQTGTIIEPKSDSTIMINGSKEELDQVNRQIECVDEEFYNFLVKDLALVDPSETLDSYGTYYDLERAKAISAIVDDVPASDECERAQTRQTSDFGPAFAGNDTNSTLSSVRLLDEIQRLWHETNQS